jgi:hypothetical protein
MPGPAARLKHANGDGNEHDAGRPREAGLPWLSKLNA